MEMKKTKTLSMLAVIILLGASVISCKQKGMENPEDSQAEATTDKNPMMEQDHDESLAAIEAYLTTIGSQYASGKVCIPSYTVVAVNDSDTDCIRVWGDWWVFNYNIVGDTLKCVSGGNHPGLMHLKQNNTHKWVVSSFDQVEDGSRNLPSAKRIFGEYYDTFHKTNSDQHHRDSVRLTQVAYYVQQHNLPVTMLQDYGWPAVELPLNQ